MLSDEQLIQDLYVAAKKFVANVEAWQRPPQPVDNNRHTQEEVAIEVGHLKEANTMYDNITQRLLSPSEYYTTHRTAFYKDVSTYAFLPGARAHKVQILWDLFNGK